MPEDTANPAPGPEDTPAKPAPASGHETAADSMAVPVPELPSERRGFLNKINPLNLFKKETPAKLVRAGRELEASRNLAQATVAFNRALAIDPDYIPAFKGLGDVMLRKGGRANVEIAIRYYLDALRRDPFNDEIYRVLGTAYEKVGKLKEAALEKKKMVVVRTLRADPGNPVANNNMGILFLQQGHTAVAIDYFSRAIKKNPRYDTALRNLATTYYKLASEVADPGARAPHVERARDYIERALEVSRSPHTLLAHARILVLEERFDEALDLCAKVQATAPGMKEVYVLKKVVLLKMNRVKEANEAYETYRYLNAHE